MLSHSQLYQNRPYRNRISLLPSVQPNRPSSNQSPYSVEKRRLLGVALFLLLLYGLLILQFFRLQVIEHEKWLAKANSQHQLVISEPARRGVFYSNTEIKKGHPGAPTPFVVDVAKFHLYVDPLSIPETARSEITAGLSKLLSLSKEDAQNISEQLEKKSHSRKLILWLDASVKDKILSWWKPLAKKKKIASNGLFFVQDWRRSYPFGKMLGQVLHTVRELRDEKTGRSIPTGGLEFVLDDYLSGKNGARLLYRSPRHEMDMGRLISAPEQGADVHLTINHYLQSIAEEEMEKQVKLAQAKGGWAIMMDPKTGEILALAQYPFFDPRDYSKYFNDPKLLDYTKLKAVTDPFEPGSTFKAITIATSLLANDELKKRGQPPLFSPEEKVTTLPCTFPGRNKILRDPKKIHHYLNMYMALQKSSNVYMGKMVQRIIERLGADWYRKTLHDVFGFGVKTGIELSGESAGLVPKPGKLHPNGKLEWSAPTPYSMCMGHNVLVNSMQMIRSFAIIANGGYDVKPTLIKKVVRDERVIYDLNRKLGVRKSQRLLDPFICKELVKAMKFVTRTGGSATKGDIPGYTEAGKTSTSEKIVNGVYSKVDHISTFVGFAPADSPRFVLMIVIDEPAHKYIPGIGSNQFGGNCAAPAFSRIGLRALEYLGVEPDDTNSQKKEVEAINELYKKWNQ